MQQPLFQMCTACLALCYWLMLLCTEPRTRDASCVRARPKVLEYHLFHVLFFFPFPFFSFLLYALAAPHCSALPTRITFACAYCTCVENAQHACLTHPSTTCRDLCLRSHIALVLFVWTPPPAAAAPNSRSGLSGGLPCPILSSALQPDRPNIIDEQSRRHKPIPYSGISGGISSAVALSKDAIQVKRAKHWAYLPIPLLILGRNG